MSTSVTRIVCHSFPQIKLFSHNIEKSFFLEGRCEEKGFQNLSTLRVKAENVEYIAGDKHAPLKLAAIFTVTSSREARGRGNDVIKRKRLSVFYRGIGDLIVM